MRRIEAGASTATPSGPAQAALQPAVWQRPASIVAIALITAAAAATVVWNVVRTPEIPGQTLRFVTANLEIEAIDYGGLSFTLSPSGLHLVYLREVDGRRQLYHRPLDQMEGVPLPTTEGALDPFFSPDSQWVGFRTGGNLRKVSLAGGEPFTVCEQCVPVRRLPGADVVTYAAGATWSAFDDTIIFSDGDALWRVAASGGTPELLAEPDVDDQAYIRPYVLPNSTGVLFEVWQLGDVRASSIATLSLETSRVSVVADEGHDPEYAPVWGQTIVDHVRR